VKKRILKIRILLFFNTLFFRILKNIDSKDKLIGCAALSAAFINGIKAFGMDETGTTPLMMLVKLSYSEIIDFKIKSSHK